MPPEPDNERSLRRQAHALKARMTIGRAGLSDGQIAQIRQALSKARLLKIRVTARDRALVEQYARELAARVPCRLLARIGFVITLAACDGGASTADGHEH